MMTNKEAIEIFTHVIEGDVPVVGVQGYFRSAIQTAIQALKRVDKLEEMEKGLVKDFRTTKAYLLTPEGSINTINYNPHNLIAYNGDIFFSEQEALNAKAKRKAK